MRRSIMVFDSDGADPVASTNLHRIMEIEDYREHLITSSDALNPWLLSDDEYGTVELFFVILYYNGLIHAEELTEGTTIKIPAATQVRKVLSYKRKEKESRTATI